eukprot:6206015-Pleurochrysis_carterae.AAC.5
MMPDTTDADTGSEHSSWDSSKLSQRSWLGNLLPWLPTKNAAYASLIELEYTLTPQKRTVVYSLQQMHKPLDAPSPIAPTFTFPPASAPAGAAGPITRLTPASATTASATPAAGPTSSIPAPVTTVRALTADERDHFIILDA